MKNKENFEQNVFIILLNTEEHEKKLESIPHRPYMDLSIVYQISDGGLEDRVLTNSDLEELGLNENEIYEMALKNTHDLRYCCVTTLNRVIEGYLFDKEASYIDINFDGLDIDDVYVLSNKEKYYGAATIVAHSDLGELANKLESNLYILPSAVHEVMVVSEQSKYDPKQLGEIVQSANRVALGEGEFLSNNIYFYDKDKRELSILQESPVKEMEMNEKKNNKSR